MSFNKRISIISGGQTGVDRGALKAALDCGIDISGWCPNGFRSEDGKIPEFLQEYMIETYSSGYLERTALNVKDSDATLILHYGSVVTPGTRITEEIAIRNHKPYYRQDLKEAVSLNTDVAPSDPEYRVDIDISFNIAAWILKNKTKILNIAGPRESKFKGIEKMTYYFVSDLIKVYRQLRME